MRLEKIQRDFLWGGGNLENKFHLVNWNTVCSSKERKKEVVWVLRTSLCSMKLNFVFSIRDGSRISF